MFMLLLNLISGVDTVTWFSPQTQLQDHCSDAVLDVRPLGVQYAAVCPASAAVQPAAVAVGIMFEVNTL